MVALHGVALFVLWTSGEYWLYKIAALGVILGSLAVHLYPHVLPAFLRFYVNKGFVSSATPLTYRQGVWYFSPHVGKQQIFNQHRIILQAGLFFVMALSSAQSCHRVVIFFDQIQEDDFKWLKLLENINKDSHVRK